METITESLDEEEINIYGDICDFDLGEEIEKLRAEKEKLEEHVATLNVEIGKLNGTIVELKDTQSNLTKNMSTLFLTAKTEVERKNRMIEDLRTQIDSKRINRFNKRKDRENSPPEINKPKKIKHDDNMTRNDVMDSQGTISEDKEQRPTYSDRNRYFEDDGRHQYRPKYFKNRYDNQHIWNRYDSRTRHSNDRYNENDRFGSRNKYYGDRYSSYEDDGYCSRSRYSCDRPERYKNENGDRYNVGSQYFSDRYNSGPSNYVNSERGDIYDNREYENSNHYLKNNVEDRRVKDRDEHKFESERRNRYADRKSVDHRDSEYFRNERQKSLERETDLRFGTPPFEPSQETRRSITPMPLPEDIEEPKPKPPKKRLKMLEEMEKKVKRSRVSQATGNSSNQSESTMKINKQTDVRNKPNNSVTQLPNDDNDKNSVASSRGSHSNIHGKEDKLDKEKNSSKKAMTSSTKIAEKLKSCNSGDSPNEVTDPAKTKSFKTKEIKAAPFIATQNSPISKNLSEKKLVDDSPISLNEKKCMVEVESASKHSGKGASEINKVTTDVAKQNTDVQEICVKGVKNDVTRKPMDNSSETLVKPASPKQTQQKSSKIGSKQSTEKTTELEVIRGEKEKDKKNDKITGRLGKQSHQSTENQLDKVIGKEDLQSDVHKSIKKGLKTKDDNLKEQHEVHKRMKKAFKTKDDNLTKQHEQRLEHDDKPAEEDVKKKCAKSTSVKQDVDKSKNDKSKDSMKQNKSKESKLSTENRDKEGQNIKEEKLKQTKMKQTSKNISNVPKQDTGADVDIKTNRRTTKKDAKINPEGDVHKQPEKEAKEKVFDDTKTDTEKQSSVEDCKNVKHGQSNKVTKFEATVTSDKGKTKMNANQREQENRLNEVKRVRFSKETFGSIDRNIDEISDSYNVHAEVTTKETCKHDITSVVKQSTLKDSGKCKEIVSEPVNDVNEKNPVHDISLHKGDKKNKQRYSTKNRRPSDEFSTSSSEDEPLNRSTKNKNVTNILSTSSSADSESVSGESSDNILSSNKKIQRLFEVIDVKQESIITREPVSLSDSSTSNNTCNSTTENRSKQSQNIKENKSKQTKMKRSFENISNVPKRDTDADVDIKTNNKTTKKYMKINSERDAHKQQEKEAEDNKVFGDMKADTEKQSLVEDRKNVEHGRSNNVMKSEGTVILDKGKTKNANQKEQKNRLNEVKRQVRFSDEDTGGRIDKDIDEISDSYNVRAEVAIEETCKHDTTSEVKQTPLKDFEKCNEIVNEPVNDLNEINPGHDSSLHKGDKKNKQRCSTKNKRPSEESSTSSSEEEPLNRSTKNNNVANILSTSSSTDSESTSGESSDDILSSNKTIHRLIDTKDVKQESIRTGEPASLSDSFTNNDTIVTCNRTTENRSKQSQNIKEDKSKQTKKNQSSENISNVPKQDSDTDSKTTKKDTKTNSERDAYKQPEKEAQNNKVFDDMKVDTEKQSSVEDRKNVEHERSSNVTKSEGTVILDKGKAKTNANQREQKNRLNEVKKQVRFSDEDTIGRIDKNIDEISDSYNVRAEVAIEETCQHDTTYEVKQSALKDSEKCKEIVNEPVSDLNEINPGHGFSLHKGDKKNKQRCSTKNKSPSESSTSSSEEEPLNRSTKNKNVANILSTSSSTDSESTSGESPDNILSSNKTIHRLIEIKDVKPESIRTGEPASLSDSSTSDDMIVTCKPDNMKTIEKKFDSLLTNYIENFKGDSPEKVSKINMIDFAPNKDNTEPNVKNQEEYIIKEDMARSTEPKVKVLEVINIVNIQGKIEVHTIHDIENSEAGSSKDFTNTERQAISMSPSVQTSTPNSVTPTRRRITPTPVKGNKPLCSFQNILTETCQSEPSTSTTQTVESPLHLTHEGEIPVLHLEENHINDLPTEMNINDKNIMNLLDSMNISNIECDIPKFKGVSGEATVNLETDEGDGGDNSSLTFENIMEKVTPVPINDTRSCAVNSGASNSVLSLNKTVNVQSGTTSTFRRKRRCWLVVRDK